MLPERVPGNKRKPRKYRISGVYLSFAIFGLNYLFEKCGFTLEGNQSDHKDTYTDLLWFGMTLP